ncbi:hypothetical protein [Acidianus sp. HS-5]|uniref:hypothetical protein n=1 Tax=Acidianus sp. HS-5 TaxID=2886040 RepID=UPI001F34E174|nr:hypothetical protein [Acidianus sp. HS-5]BDC18212.1 hypothetical protein HS5_11020 [Acidianus sp. HS-5]
MSLNPSKKILKAINFSDFYENKIPLLQVELECPKIERGKIVLGLIDTGSRYTIINKYAVEECFTKDDLKTKYTGRVVINNKEYERYSFRFTFPQLDNISEIFNAAIMEYSLIPEELVPSVILGREDFLKRVVICMYKSEWMTIYKEF